MFKFDKQKWALNYKKYLEARKNKTNNQSTKISQIKIKKAILLGLNYPGTRFKLFGCINDVRSGARYLRKLKYDTKVLIDKDIKPNYNLLEALNEFNNSKFKQIVFHYSGHGSQTKDMNGDETDKLDETVFSAYNKEITDDEISNTLKQFKGKKVFLIFDCCHSGSIVDLPFTLNKDKIFQLNKNTFKSEVICISGCADFDVSADVTEGKTSYGALSHTLYKLLKKANNKWTWKQLYQKLLIEMKKNKYSQIPQISASHSKLFDQKVSL